MAIEQLKPQSAAPTSARSEVRFPGYNLADSIEVPKAIHVKGGGACTLDHLAAFLDYKGTKNGAFITKVGAARTFGLITKSGNLLVPTQRAHQIISPTYAHESKQALVDAFFNVPLFQRIHDDFRGKELPPEFGMKNALRTQYGVIVNRVDLAYRMLMESAETAGFFSTKMGMRSHLITPMIHPSAGHAQAVQAPSGNEWGDSEFGGPPTPPPPPPPPAPPPPPSSFQSGSPINDVKAQYLSTLIKLFEAKSQKGELDSELMDRIERLLGSS